MQLCTPYFRQAEQVRDYNQLKMLRAFTGNQMSSSDLLGTTGYGLWDTGRAKLEAIFAQVMGCEDALVRSQFMSGTHTLAVALFGLLRAGDTLLAATGRPYDTLEGVIGIEGKGEGTGTLTDYGVRYEEVPLKPDFTPDYEAIAAAAPRAKVCHIQRSRGYLQRNAFDLDTIRKVAEAARSKNPGIIVFVDNCYGEFTQTAEPSQAGADLIAGSLIKNPGGGIAPTGGYIAGRRDLVEQCAYRPERPRPWQGPGLHPGRPARDVPGALLRAGRGVRGGQDRHLRPVPAGTGGQTAGAPATATPTTTSSPALTRAAPKPWWAFAGASRRPARWTATPCPSPAPSRATPTRWSWQAAASPRAAPSS